MINVTSVVLRYDNDAEFHAKVYRVMQIMEQFKGTRLTDEERSIICIAAGLAIEVNEQEMYILASPPIIRGETEDRIMGYGKPRKPKGDA